MFHEWFIDINRSLFTRVKMHCPGIGKRVCTSEKSPCSSITVSPSARDDEVGLFFLSFIPGINKQNLAVFYFDSGIRDERVGCLWKAHVSDACLSGLGKGSTRRGREFRIFHLMWENKEHRGKMPVI